ncbi:hypothetical protein [Ramlibacter rhizophilus]|uniref:Uncharacterized protein n=1 Tax=Ramlibacter rhizophilus TaxID=1781167 RepID=A0A4Z0C233_9BURK|nr:hypothetical protein [Ramlibacter rhizophilus]TFZ05012.1 hypothetical protein EZ242_04500 [Ramlibacter rhizophilus]
MTTHPDEFGDLKQRLLESALDATLGQLDEAEKLVAQRFPDLKSGAQRSQLVLVVAQVIATNYLAAATVRNVPKG